MNLLLLGFARFTCEMNDFGRKVIVTVMMMAEHWFGSEKAGRSSARCHRPALHICL